MTQPTGTPGAPLDAYRNRSDDWFRSAEGRQVATNVLSWQTPAGGWPKNQDTSAPAAPHNVARLQPTFDNGATTRELRFLGRAADVTGEPAFQAALLKGLEYVLHAQYTNGGWPQQFPPGTQYHRHITCRRPHAARQPAQDCPAR